MKKIVKQVVGIDIDKELLVSCLGRMHDDWNPELICHKTFINKEKGFNDLIATVKKLTDTECAGKICDGSHRCIPPGTGLFLT